MGRHCKICDIYLPNDNAADQHEKGKKHQKILAAQQSRDELIKRSVYLFGFAPHSITEQDLSHFLSSQFQAISPTIHLDKAKGTFAVVEFAEKATAYKVLECRKFKLNGQGVKAVERKVTQTTTAGKQLQLDVSTTPEEQSDHLLQSLASENTVNGQLLAVQKCLKLTDIQERRDICQKLQNALHSFFPENAYLCLVGSSMTELGIDGSDVDMTLLIEGVQEKLDSSEEKVFCRTSTHLLNCDVSLLSNENRLTVKELSQLNPYDRIKLLSRIINLARRLNHLPIPEHKIVPGRRVPLVQFVWAQKFRCDVAFNNFLSLNNSQWLKLIADKEPRFAPVLFAIRYWAKIHGFIGCERYLMSNYALTLMLVTFFQSKGLLPPVKQQMIEGDELPETNLINGWECTFPKQWTSNGDQTTEELLKGFFSFYSDVAFKKVVVCPYLGKLYPVDQLSSLIPEDQFKWFKASFLTVMDPFVLDHNTTASVAAKIVFQMRRHLRRALKLTQSAQTPFNLTLLLSPKQAESRISSSNGAHSSPVDIGELAFVLDSLTDIETNVWCEKAVKTVRFILEELLYFHPIENDEEEEPKCKRMKLSEWNVNYKITHLTWQGRRHKRREVTRENPSFDEAQIEKEVTRRVISEQNVSINYMFSLLLHSDQENAQLEISFHSLSSGFESEFRNLFHFLEPFIRGLVPKLLLKI